MTDLVHQLLVARRAIGREGEHVFFGYGKSGHCESFTYALSQIADKTGIRVSPHDLRRTYASVAATTPDIPPIALKRHCQVASSGRAMGKTSSAGVRLQAQLRRHRATCRRRHCEPCDTGWH